VRDLPLIGITMGDPSGIGPEIIVKALGDDPGLYELCRPIILGDAQAVSSTIWEGGRDMWVHIIRTPSEAVMTPGRINLVPVSELSKGEIGHGVPTLEGGKAMVQYIIRAVEWAKSGTIDAMVTCPINKSLMQRAGYSYEGHTELIATYTGAENCVMMLAGESLRVTLVTIHCALKEVPSMVTTDRVHRTIAVSADSLERDFGFENPRLAVAGLNPHAGEGGLFGTEEQDSIAPAVARAVEEGLTVEGPAPPDTVFYRAVHGEFDAVVAMYHDQGLIPLKLLHFSDAVNVTLGLPIIRTSVDHGTAYDIAGTWEADPSSLSAALRMAAMMVNNRKRASR